VRRCFPTDCVEGMKQIQQIEKEWK
jgi:hypothetical protein